jgi:hypothetical protein
MARRSRPHLALVLNWSLAAVLPAVGCALYWLWIATSTTAHECETGSRGSTVGLAVFGALVLLTPAGIMLQGWRARLPSAYVAPAAVMGAGIAVIAIFVTGSIWWSGHDCMT